MEIILIQDVERLGHKDDIVKVKDGYARNYLIPKKMAVIATESAKKVLAENKRQRAHKEAKLIEDAQTLAARLDKLKVSVGVKASSTGKIFGSVTPLVIAEAINKNGYEIDRKQIVVSDDHIKELGNYTVKVKLHKEVYVEVDLEVVAE
ncbi:MAG TPA: 50S ribosomal protein L9 [Prolixibacteraceae bacterium]|nr:50S ribosomal protein L9 [Prolixibacteraceae bacterium]